MKKYGTLLPTVLQKSTWFFIRCATVPKPLIICGIENIKNTQGGVIFASNHSSELDPLFLVSSLPFSSSHLPLFFVARPKGHYQKWWRKLLYGGTFFKIMGAYPAYSGLNNYETALRHHIEIIKQGNSVCIFPTGEKVSSTDHVPPKTGVVHLAELTNAPIIPTAIQGLYKEDTNNVQEVRIMFGKPIFINDAFKRQLTSSKKENLYELAAAEVMKQVSHLQRAP